MQRPLLKLLLLSCLVVTAYGCGGGSSDPDTRTVAEGVSFEDVPPEDLGFADRSLVPAVFVVVTPRAGAGGGDSWVVWPESLAMNVLDENNMYAKEDDVLSWPDAFGAIYSSRADCSAFVTLSLMKAFGFGREDIDAWMGSKNPSSARYHDNILFQNNFQRIQRAPDIRRGDILAMKYLDKASGGTGHAMIAASAPALRSSTEPVIDGTVQYELRVIDSTASLHGTDTRTGTGANGGDQDGAGLGTMRLYADAVTGQITGYTWSLSSGSTYFTATSPADDRRSLKVGRMTFTQ